jgi:hypothetical protein
MQVIKGSSCYIFSCLKPICKQVIQFSYDNTRLRSLATSNYAPKCSSYGTFTNCETGHVRVTNQVGFTNIWLGNDRYDKPFRI